MLVSTALGRAGEIFRPPSQEALPWPALADAKAERSKAPAQKRRRTRRRCAEWPNRRSPRCGRFRSLRAAGFLMMRPPSPAGGLQSAQVQWLSTRQPEQVPSVTLTGSRTEGETPLAASDVRESRCRPPTRRPSCATGRRPTRTLGHVGRRPLPARGKYPASARAR